MRKIQKKILKLQIKIFYQKIRKYFKINNLQIKIRIRHNN